MRSGFGRLAQEIRAQRGMSQTEFAERMGVSLSRVSNIEFQRTSISDRVVGDYIRVLDCSGSEAHRLREQARFSEALRKNDDEGDLPPLQAMLEVFGNRLTPTALAKIQEIVERDVGKTVAALRFQSSQLVKSKAKLKKRPSLTPKRFAQIVTLASRIRQEHANETTRLNIPELLEATAAAELNFDYRIVDRMPSFTEGAFACMLGDKDGHCLLIEEDRFRSMGKGVFFFRHVVCHEMGHHYLHGTSLASAGKVFLAPQELAKNSTKMIGEGRQIEQVIDTIEEEEAECFATFFLVPWEAFRKGTTAKHLSRDYGAQQSTIERFQPYFQQKAVLEAICQELWNQGERSHPIFTDVN